MTTPDPRDQIRWTASRAFVHPLFDYGLIGGGLSVVLFAAALGLGYGDTGLSFSPTAVAACVLFTTSAHFAASTVRLYTKPGTAQRLPRLRAGFPILLLALMPITLLFADRIGAHLNALYLTWSPYHYAAQTYGLAVMYCFRSGFALDDRQKRWLRRICLIPFGFMLLYGKGCGLDWLLSESLRAALPGPLLAGLRAGYSVLPVLGFAAPLVAFGWAARDQRKTPPLIAALLVITNGMWWFVLNPLDAFVWATVFHGVQYMAIVVVFHVREQSARPENRHGWLGHTLGFYALSLVGGYGLFTCLPYAFVASGFGPSESLLLVVAVINLHHFIVDAFVWRLRPGDTNRSIVDAD